MIFLILMAPTLAGFFDTYPQGGFNVGNYFGADYRGNWGAYPYFPSGLILAVDMQNGIFLLQANALLGTAVGLNQIPSVLKTISVFPKSCKNQLTIQLQQEGDYVISLKNILGQTVLEHTANNPFKEITLNTSNVASGHYILTVASQSEIISSRKLIIQH